MRVTVVRCKSSPSVLSSAGLQLVAALASFSAALVPAVPGGSVTLAVAVVALTACTPTVNCVVGRLVVVETYVTSLLFKACN